MTPSRTSTNARPPWSRGHGRRRGAEGRGAARGTCATSVKSQPSCCCRPVVSKETGKRKNFCFSCPVVGKKTGRKTTTRKPYVSELQPD